MGFPEGGTPKLSQNTFFFKYLKLKQECGEDPFFWSSPEFGGKIPD